MYVPRDQKKTIAKLIDYRKSIEYVREVKSIVKVEFEQVKAELIRELDNHAVTQEIEAGPSASNTSGTLGGRGNLFSFIGFNAGADPITPIRVAFDQIILTSTMIRRDGSAESYVMSPSADDIFRITPLPWADGRSWAEGIEKGIANLGNFLNKPTEESRSGGGIQSKNSVSGANFRPVPYIKDMISNFDQKINNLNNKIYI